MIRVPLTGKHGIGKFALIDDEFADLLGSSWRVDPHGYARRTKFIEGKRTTQMLHHFILPRREGLIVDHINRNRLDNRKSNLRLVTYKINRQNSSRVCRSIDGYPYLQAYQDNANGRWKGYVVFGYEDGKVNRKYMGSDKLRATLVKQFKETYQT